MANSTRYTPPNLSKPHGYLAVIGVLAAASCDKRLTEFTRQALSVLAQYCDNNGSCFMGQSTIANLLGSHRQSVNRALQKVVKYGYLTSKKRRKHSGGSTTNIYQLNLDLALGHGRILLPITSVPTDVENNPTKRGTPPVTQSGDTRLHPPEVSQRNQSEETNTKRHDGETTHSDIHSTWNAHLDALQSASELSDIRSWFEVVVPEYDNGQTITLSAPSDISQKVLQSGASKMGTILGRRVVIVRRPA